MIISRAPLRITLGGGGTDLPSYYKNHGGGFLVAAAINKHIYVSTHENFENEYLLKYSQIEKARLIQEIRHPIIREALESLKIQPGIEISSLADIPAGTGLGSSGTFTVSLLKSICDYRSIALSNLEIAKLACEIEIERLGNPVGKQDQYISALGGIKTLEFLEDGEVICSELGLPSSSRKKLENNLLLFFTGIRRSATEELAALEGPNSELNTKMITNLNDVKNAGIQAAKTLQDGKLTDYAGMLTEQWKLKLLRSPTEVNMKVDDWITQGITAGALGGKLVGAGGGGFLLFYTEEHLELRQLMFNLGLREVGFEFDDSGASIVS